ncbi:hypothetical protein [Serratia proteamaculans]
MKNIRALLSSALLLCLASVSNKAAAYVLVMSDVVSGYSDCNLTDLGNGTSLASVLIAYKEAAGRTGYSKFWSRGIMFYSYTSKGQPQYGKPTSVFLGGELSAAPFEAPGYLIYRGLTSVWKNEEKMTVRAEVILSNTMLTIWPAVSIRAGNYTSGDDVGEISGGAYISVGDKGGCSVVTDPSKPPPPSIHITVSAPDWDLGEIKPGQQSIPFTASSDQLCMKYTSADVAGKQFIITASNQNGLENSQYRMKNLEDASQIIPYQVNLNSGTSNILLPNRANSALQLDTGGKTCFMPTFTTFAPKSIKQGNYSDVLTFNIVTKA